MLSGTLALSRPVAPRYNFDLSVSLYARRFISCLTYTGTFALLERVFPNMTVAWTELEALAHHVQDEIRPDVAYRGVTLSQGRQALLSPGVAMDLFTH